ncbi:MAG TPA: SDR family NAD(P)-dependent oxidoreductase [Nevskiaceae bacterium]|nr:SDR family NAD(P)-dependent oxidoreductase [Nevskiaceae bacterium]
MPLAGQRALITGAGSGLGRALALRLAAHGWRVACSDRDLAAAQATLALIEKTGGRGLALALDVSRDDAFVEPVAGIAADWGGLDLLVNNAGVATAGTVAEADLAQWRFAIEINLLGCVRGARAVIPLMSAQGAGHIVNVASFAGIANPPALASYSATKAAVISLSETLRFELAPHGVGVSVACPSFFRTNLMATSQASAPPGAANPAPQMERIVNKLMDTATVTADDVAADIHDAVLKNRFLVITHGDARARYHIKRLAPETFYKLARNATAGFLKK